MRRRIRSHSECARVPLTPTMPCRQRMPGAEQDEIEAEGNRDECRRGQMAFQYRADGEADETTDEPGSGGNDDGAENRAEIDRGIDALPPRGQEPAGDEWGGHAEGAENCAALVMGRAAGGGKAQKDGDITDDNQANVHLSSYPS